MKTNLIMTVGLIAMLGICGTAVDAKAKGSSTGQEEKSGDKKQQRKQRWEQTRKTLLEKYPEEMKAIRTLRKTDKDAARAKMKALITKAIADGNLEPRKKKSGKRGDYLLKKYPEEMKAIQELRKTDPEAAKAKLKALIAKAKAERKQNKKGKKE
jgi:hypothetical protein